MAGRRSFSELRARLSPEAQAQAEAESMALGEKMKLAEVQRAMTEALDSGEEPLSAR